MGEPLGGDEQIPVEVVDPARLACFIKRVRAYLACFSCRRRNAA